MAGCLLDTGAVDEAIRQLNMVTQRDKTNAVALYMQAQAYRMKDLYPQSIDSARASISLAPARGRTPPVAGGEPSAEWKFPIRSTEYTSILRLSDFDSKLAGRMNYYVLGFLAGIGKK